MKSKCLIIIVVFLTILNFLLLYKVITLYKYIKTSHNLAPSDKNYLRINSVPYFDLFDLKGKRYTTGEIVNISPFTLLVFFSLTDCASCLMEHELWQKIAKRELINVVGIARHIDKDELKIWVENSGINFPILYDRDSQITQNFGIKNTPLKILINSEGKVLLIDSVRTTPNEKEEFIDLLENFIIE